MNRAERIERLAILVTLAAMITFLWSTLLNGQAAQPVPAKDEIRLPAGKGRRASAVCESNAASRPARRIQLQRLLQLGERRRRMVAPSGNEGRTSWE